MCLVRFLLKTSNQKVTLIFLVRFSGVNPTEYFGNYMDLKENLENLLSRKVDLVEIQTLKNPIFIQSIERSKTILYERKNTKMLFDIQATIDEIESFFKNYPLDFNLYKSNLILKRAVERDLEIIGEAVNRIIKQNENFPIENAKRIIGLRNQIIHAYDNISDDNIWAILVKHIPLLKQEIKMLIENKNNF